MPYKALQKGKNLRSIGVGLDLGHDVGYDSLLVNDKGAAHNAEPQLAVQLFLLPCTKGLNGKAIGVGQKNKGQIILLGEFDVRCRAVAADADDHDILLLECLVCARKCASLTGAAGGIILGIEIHDDLFSKEVGKRYGIAVLIV